MAKIVRILAKENIVKIIIDGNEIHDVVAYKLEEDKNGAFLTLTVPVERLNIPISLQQPKNQVNSKGLLCLSRHFAVWYENIKNGNSSDFGRPCIGCQNQPECHEYGYPWFKLISPILDSQGVQISLAEKGYQDKGVKTSK